MRVWMSPEFAKKVSAAVGAAVVLAAAVACFMVKKMPGPSSIAPQETVSAPLAPPRPAVAASASTVSAKRVSELLHSVAPPTVLDVRTPGEFARGHIQGALNIDFQATDFKERLGSLDRSKPYVVHCQAGGRSGKAMTMMQGLSFQNLLHMSGGFSEWEESGLPVAK